MFTFPPMHETAHALHRLLAEESEPVELTVTLGAVPADLSGVFLANGPGRNFREDRFYGHPLDGDGFITRVSIADGRVTYQGRWVRTREFEEEERAARPLYRSYGTNLPGGMRGNGFRPVTKNPANTHVVSHGGHTLALWEGGWPHRIDPGTLATLGRWAADGALVNRAIDRWLTPELPFAAHARLDDRTGELWGFGAVGGLRNRMMLWVIGPDGTLSTRRELALSGLPLVHDFVLTPTYAVFVLPAARSSLTRMLLGLAPLSDTLRVVDAPGAALLVPRDGGPTIRLEVPPGVVSHWIHGWEDPIGRVVLDGVKYPQVPAPPSEAFAPGQAWRNVARPTRLTLDPGRRTAREERLADHAMEFPRTLARIGRPYDVAWGVGAPPDRQHPFLSCTVRLDRLAGVTHCRDFGRATPSEPIPVAGADGLPQWVLQTLHRPDRTELLVLRADTLETEAVLNLPVALPPRQHGSWAGA
ncbi:MAG: all-trans-8'-apo-beta-carotenal 15,15'-oxygenase [Myxococcota bacterium]